MMLYILHLNFILNSQLSSCENVKHKTLIFFFQNTTISVSFIFSLMQFKTCIANVGSKLFYGLKVILFLFLIVYEDFEVAFGVVFEVGQDIESCGPVETVYHAPFKMVCLTCFFLFTFMNCLRFLFCFIPHILRFLFPCAFQIGLSRMSHSFMLFLLELFSLTVQNPFFFIFVARKISMQL